MKILILTTGSISAYLSHKLAVTLKKDGHEVKHYATEAASLLMSGSAQFTILRPPASILLPLASSFTAF